MPYPQLSLIVPMFNECEVLDLFFQRVIKQLEKHDDTFEIVCVNDGSTDATGSRLAERAAADPRIKVINLSRNFGKEQALTAGIDYSCGQAIIPMDCDLQDPPELIPEMIAAWRDGFQVVLAQRAHRPGDSGLKRTSSSLFYKVINRLSDIDIPENVGDFRLMDRKVIDALQLYPERTRFMKGLFASLGFKHTTLQYVRPGRAAGSSAWNYNRLYKLAIDGIISFTSLPLKLWSYLGAVTAIGAFCYGLYLIIRTLVFGVDVPGYASLMVVMLIMTGLILLSLGVIGEYISRIFIEVKQRPIYIVMDTIGFDE